MNLRSSAAALLTFGLGIGCAGAPGGDASSASEQQRIAANSPSDVGICYPSPPAAPEAINADVITGLLVAARPQIMECMVDPRHRGQETETRVSIKTTVGGGKVEHAVSGQNVTPPGQECIRGALDRYLAAVPGWAAKAAAVTTPVTGEAQVAHKAGVSPSVKFGINEASDVTGAVRIAQPTWCDCYADWKAAPPRALEATIKVTQAGKPQASFKPSADPGAQKVAACLAGKVAELPLKTKSSELDVPYTFRFVHSGHAAPLPEAAPEQQFQQQEALRGQRTAAAVVALGTRTAAATAYDGLVQKYNAAPDSVKVEDLKSTCAALVTADDTYIAALEKQLEAEQQMLTVLQQLKAQDTAWATAETAAQGTVDTTRQDIASAKQMKTSDTGACPREAQ
ncbi:MAG TPA: hypothetical protein VFF45_00380 [Bacilli bacterium]|nr:hypothetical protein [Bacilli bacterium]